MTYRTPRVALWRPNSPKQAAFLASTEFEVLYGGAKGGAKTESLVMDPLQFVDRPHYKGLLLREVFGELQEIQTRCKRYYPRCGGRWEAKEERWVFPSGAQVRVGYCETVEDVNRYQGQEWSDVLFDELGNLKDEGAWDLLLAEIRSPDPTLPRRARATANPGGKGHAWIKRRFITATHYGQSIYSATYTLKNGQQVVLERRFVPSKVTDNPVYANDALYMATLMALPDARREMLLEGNWDASEGMALDELNQDKHFIRGSPPAVPAHAFVWGGFDWGFRHPWCFPVLAANEDGDTWCVDTFHGKRQRPDEIAARIVEGLDGLFPGQGPKRLAMIHAGRDCFDEVKARGENTPSIAEQFMEYGLWMDRANVSRVLGLNNMRAYLAWRGTDPAVPRLRFFDTPGNRRLFECLQSMVVDPTRIEDALKTDADDSGKGGDDPYDALRYGLAARPLTPSLPLPAKKTWPDQDEIAQDGRTFEDEFTRTGSGGVDWLPTGY